MSKLKRFLLNLFFIPFYWVFSYIIPKKENLILFGSYFGYRFIGNPKHFYLYLLNKRNSGYSPFWITRNQEIYHTLKKDLKPVVYLYSFSGIWKILRAKYLLIEAAAQDITGITFLLGNFNIINLWHGTPLKDISLDSKKDQTLYDKAFNFFIKKELKLYKFVLSCSENAAKNMKFALLNNNVRTLGYPRNDIFFNKNLSYVNYKQKLYLYKYNKILLYAPTFRDNKAKIMPFSQNFLIQLNNYLRNNNYILLIKNHPASLFGKRIQISNLSNIQNISNVVDDIQEILIYVDILITDYSSSLFEFCITSRPIIFYCYDYDDYIKNCRKMYYNYFQEMPGPFARNEEELIDLIKNVDQWFDYGKYKEKYELFRDKFNQYRDGKSCQRLYEFIRKGNF